MKLITDSFKKHKKLKVNEIDELADFLELNVVDDIPDNDCYKLYDKINSQFKNPDMFDFIGIYMNLTEFFLKDSTTISNYFNYKNIAICKNNKIKKMNMFDYFKDSFIKNKKIFISLDVYGYGHTEGEEFPYDAHSLIIIFTPINNNNYKCVFINTHGRDYTYDYEIVYSSKRRKKIKYKYGLDYHFMNMFISNLNIYLKKRTQIHVLFDKTSEYMYKGVNFQSGDSRGYCYLFPILIYYYYRRYYDCERNIDGYKIESSYDLISGHKLDKFMSSCLIEYCKPYKHKLFEIRNKKISDYYEELETILCKQDFRLFKKIASIHLHYCEKLYWLIDY